MAVAAELGRCQSASGDVAGVIVSNNRDATIMGVDNFSVDFTEYCPREWFTKAERLRDAVSGRLGWRRRFTGDLYIPAIEAAVGWRPDAVLLYEGLFVAGTVPAWRQALPDAALIVYLHSALARSYGRRELQHALADVDYVVCVSEFLRSQVLARVPKLADRTVVVPNGVDLATFHSVEPSTAIRAEGPAGTGGSEPFTLLFVGQMAAHKGPDLMLRAMARAADLTDRPLSAQLVGSSDYDAGDALTEYEQTLRDLARTSNVDAAFLPFTAKDTLADLYRRADVVCVPSIVDETFGMVAAEAMACGTPVIATPRGGLLEVGGDAVVFVDPEDTYAFAAVIAGLADDPSEVARLAEAGLQRSQGRTWEAATQRLGELSRRA